MVLWTIEKWRKKINKLSSDHPVYKSIFNRLRILILRICGKIESFCVVVSTSVRSQSSAVVDSNRHPIRYDIRSDEKMKGKNKEELIQLYLCAWCVVHVFFNLGNFHFSRRLCNTAYIVEIDEENSEWASSSSSIKRTTHSNHCLW